MSVVKKILGVTMVCLLAAATAFAGAPVPGTYTNLGGDLDNGRFGESFAVANDYFTAGNVHNGASWNGAALGLQWWWSCATVAVANLAGTVGSQEHWEITYNTANATFFLNGTGESWDGGDAVYTGVIDQMTDDIAAIVFAGSVVGWNSTIQWSGHFDTYTTSCITVTCNTAWIGGGMNPGGYPAFTESDCSTARTFGTWGTITAINVAISECSVPTENATWGAIKSLYTK